MRALHQAGEFIMLRWDDGSAADTTWYPMEPPVLVIRP